MKKLILLILIVAGIWYWYKNHSSQDGIFDENGNPVVMVFTVADCGPCQDVTEFLNKRDVPYQEIEINPSDNQDNNVKLWKKSGEKGFPYTLAGHSKVVGTTKWGLISLLGTNFGDQYLTYDEQYFFKQHFNEEGYPQIVLYGVSWCPYCVKLRKEFNDKSTAFVDIDVEGSGEKERMTSVMEIQGYPALWVGYTRVSGTEYDDVMKVVKAEM